MSMRERQEVQEVLPALDQLNLTDENATPVSPAGTLVRREHIPAFAAHRLGDVCAAP
jgi:hypothetical protein